MKRLTNLLLILSVMTLFSCSIVKRVPVSDNDLKMISVIKAPGIEKDKLYTIVNEWLVITFVDAEAVVQYQDKSAGKVMGKHVGTYERAKSNKLYISNLNKYKSVISIDVKNEKVRIVFMKPMYLNGTKEYTGYLPVKYKGTMEGISRDWMSLAEDLEDYITAYEEWK